MENTGALLDMPRPKKAKNVGGRPKVPAPKKPIASFRGTEEFAAWFEGLANHVHLPASVLIEHALRQYAERQGYKPPAPKR
jgi:hypothetical protein